jgi:hypothetical protein
MTRFQVCVLLAAALALGCGGKLLEDPNQNDGASPGDVNCDSSGNPFVGSWHCNLSATEISSSGTGFADPGPFDFASTSDGGLTLTLVSPGDAGGPTCTIPLRLAGATATIPGQPVCYNPATNSYVTFAGGTFSVSGCGSMSIVDLIGEVRAYVGTPAETDYVDSDTGSCSRN